MTLPIAYIIRRGDGLFSNGSSYRPVFVQADRAATWATKRSVSCHVSRIKGIWKRQAAASNPNYNPGQMPYLGCEIVECEVVPKKGTPIQ